MSDHGIAGAVRAPQGSAAPPRRSGPQPPVAADEHPLDERDRDAAELAHAVGRNLKRLRLRRGHSLERLSGLSGVSRAMLSQIEQGRSVPTIALLWKVARALEVPFAALTSEDLSGGTVLLRAGRAKVLSSADGSFTSRALFPFQSGRRVEFYKLTLAPGATEAADAHAPGTVENLTVLAGQVEIEVAGHVHLVNEDDAMLFEADVPHSYRNISATRAVIYMVMTYIERIG